MRFSVRPSLRALVFLSVLALVGAYPAVAAHDRKWSDFGQDLCEAKGEGIFFERYDNGEVKASVVCGEYKDALYVKQARYFDRHGRGLANEQNVPENPAQSRYLEWTYKEEAGPPVASRLYDGVGKLIEEKPFVVASSSASTTATPRWVPGTFNQYLEICRSQPGAALQWIGKKLDDRQFFEESSCPCLAEKAVRVDEDKDPGFMRSKNLDPANFADRLAVAGARNLSACLCPNAVPGTALEDACHHASDVESDWRRRD